MFGSIMGIFFYLLWIIITTATTTIIIPSIQVKETVNQDSTR